MNKVEFVEGRIIQSLAGFYYVETCKGLLECRAKGIFRKRKMKPVVGDLCKVQLLENELPMVAEISPRKNHLIRPPMANLDELYLVVSMAEPLPNLRILDRLLITAEYQKVPISLVLTKTDLGATKEIKEIYEEICGYQIFLIDYQNKDTISSFKSDLKGKLSAFSGNSGVGKSTLLNHIDPKLLLETNVISNKLGRGKHTTRDVCLYRLDNDTLIADTPGFSSIEMDQVARIPYNELDLYFPEFQQYLGQCKFRDCVHMEEISCAIKNAVDTGKIPMERYQSYRTLFEEAKKRNDWNS